jgi:8-oxo-dGTP pyrophosphatase MutT (NUDIX family)
VRKIPHPGRRFESLIAGLEASLSRPLPGAPAHERLQPRPVAGISPARPVDRGRPAAGLILLYPRESRPEMLLTVRSGDLPTHPGQVSLPGGIQEAGESLEETALREAEEEVGVNPASTFLLGSLSPVFIPPSGFLLHPYIGACREIPRFQINDAEVAKLLEVPISDLKDPDRLRSERRNLRGRDYEVPYFLLNGEKIWGATAMVLSEFLWILEEGKEDRPGKG